MFWLELFVGVVVLAVMSGTALVLFVLLWGSDL